MMELLLHPWPWYVAGPLIGLVVPALLLVGGRLFGVSSNFRHMCAIVAPGRNAFLRYDWKRTGLWNLVFALGILIGGFIVANFMTPSDYAVAISDATRTDLAALGITDLGGLAPRQLFDWSSLLTLRGLLVVVGGGFLVGFGSRWAGGCTSGHGITGLASFQLPSLVAVIGFFVGGVAVSFLLLPLILGGAS
jgi:uncharacterized membrane protein YedE/YeeE